MMGTISASNIHVVAIAPIIGSYGCLNCQLRWGTLAICLSGQTWVPLPPQAVRKWHGTQRAIVINMQDMSVTMLLGRGRYYSSMDTQSMVYLFMEEPAMEIYIYLYIADAL